MTSRISPKDVTGGRRRDDPLPFDRPPPPPPSSSRAAAYATSPLSPFGLSPSLPQSSTPLSNSASRPSPSAAAAASSAPPPLLPPPPPPPPSPHEIALVRAIQAHSSSLNKNFLQLDVDRDGYVTRSDLRSALHNTWGIDLNREQMDALFVRFAYFENDHRDSDGLVDDWDSLFGDNDNENEEEEEEEEVDCGGDNGDGGSGDDEVGAIPSSPASTAASASATSTPSSACNSKINTKMESKSKSKKKKKKKKEKKRTVGSAIHHGIRYGEFVRYIESTLLEASTIAPYSSTYGSTLNLSLSSPSVSRTSRGGISASSGGGKVVGGGSGGNETIKGQGMVTGIGYDHPTPPPTSLPKMMPLKSPPSLGRKELRSVLARLMRQRTRSGGGGGGFGNTDHGGNGGMGGKGKGGGGGGAVGGGAGKKTQLFLEMDVRRDGRVSADEFRNWFSIHGELDLSDEDMRLVLGECHYRHLTNNEKGGMDFQEFSNVVDEIANNEDCDDEDGIVELDGGKLMSPLSSSTTTTTTTTTTKPTIPTTTTTPTKSDKAVVMKTPPPLPPPLPPSLSHIRRHLSDAIQTCVDDASSDRNLIRRLSQQLYKKRTRLIDAFRTYDIDGDGKLSAVELRMALKKTGMLDVSEERAISLVSKFDRDGDGKLNRGDFVRLIAFGGDEDCSDDGNENDDNDDDNKKDNDEKKDDNKKEVGTKESEKTNNVSTLPVTLKGTPPTANTLSSSASSPPPPTSTSFSSVGIVTTPTSTSNSTLISNSSPPATVDRAREELRSSLRGHEDEPRHVDIVNRLDDDDVATIQRLREALLEERRAARRIFEDMDRDNTKDLSSDELKAGFQRLGIQVSDEHIRLIMRRFDPQNTGRLRYYQFVRLLSANLDNN